MTNQTKLTGKLFAAVCAALLACALCFAGTAFAAGLPDFDTLSADPGENDVTLTATLKDTEKPDEYGVLIGKKSTDLSEANKVTDADEMDSMTLSVDGLDSSTRYYYQFYYKDGDNTVESAVESFKTADTEVPMTRFDLNYYKTLSVGTNSQFSITRYPANTTDKNKVSWKSSDTDVATVDDNGLVTAKAAGTVTITATCSRKAASVEVTVRDTKNEVTMFRLYNPNSGEHFYTSDETEKDGLVKAGWNDEGTGWIAPKSGAPVYRLYNQNGGEHHYTLDENERDNLVDAGWTDEGVGFYSGGDVAVYREYNPNAFANNHNYTPNANEHEYLLSIGWNNEHTAWYAVAAK